MVLHLRDGENRFNAASMAEWHRTLDELAAVEGPLALVTTGAGKFYSNGLDLDWMTAHPDEATSMLADVHRLFGRILGFSAITVAAVNGHAFAGGAMLAVAHDFMVMREDRGYWCLPEVDLGLPLTPAMHALVTAKLPRVAAHEAMVTGRRYTGTDARSAGFAHRVAPEGALLDEAVALATEHAGKDRGVIGAHKRLSFGAAIELCG